MRLPRSWLLLPLAAAALAAAATVLPMPARTVALQGMEWAWSAAVLASCAAAASAFTRSDVLAFAWTGYAVAYGVPVLFKPLDWAVQLGALPASLSAVCDVPVTLLLNAATIVGAGAFAAAWRGAAPGFAASRLRRWTAVLGGVAVAVAIAGPALARDLGQWRAGVAGAPVEVISDAGDIVTFSLVAPLVLTAVALRGGALAWPWALLAAGNVLWLAFDAAQHARGASPAGVAFAEIARCAGDATYCAAALAQRWVLAPRARADDEGRRAA